MIKDVLKKTALSASVLALAACSSVSKESEQLSREQVQPYADANTNYYKVFGDRGQKVVFANGTTMHFEIVGNQTTAIGGENDGNWVVNESGDRLTVSVDGENIDITDALKAKGYFHYDYRDDADILHRLYIVRNAGGTKDYAERWYSQQEWLPELGLGGGSRGVSGPLGEAIMSADFDAEHKNVELDTALQKHLKQYWNEYEEKSI